MWFVKIIIINVLLNLSKSQTSDRDITNHKHLESFVELSGGEFLVGINDIDGIHYEHPFKRALVKPFSIMLYPVTIGSFRKFIQKKTAYETTAQKNGYSFVHQDFLDPHALIRKSRNHESQYDGMVAVHNTRWNKPEGGESNTQNKINYPVTHVSLLDAQTYCKWIGMRLPSEMEWEYAARGNLKEKLYPWGNEWFKGISNLKDEFNDNYKGISPVDAFGSQNLYEMYDLIGNVWEWTTTTYIDALSRDKEVKYVLKGGSFLDSFNGTGNNKNMKIRISSRYPVRPTFTAQNIGFRCAQDIDYKLNENKFNVVKLRAPILHDYHEDNSKNILINDEL